MRYLNVVCALCAVMLFAFADLSCNSNSVSASGPPKINKVKIAEAADADMRIEFYSDDSLHTGINRVYVRAFHSSDGKMLREANVEVHPIMFMSSGLHYAPYGIGSYVADADGLLTGVAICTMPSGALGEWTFVVKVYDAERFARHEYSFALHVKESPELCAVKATDGTEYFCILDFAPKMQVGMNGCSIWIYKHESETVITEMAGLELETKVMMTAMGHSSSGNTTPYAVGHGLYGCKLNFSMPGTWNVTLLLKRGGINIGNAIFNLDV